MGAGYCNAECKPQNAGCQMQNAEAISMRRQPGRGARLMRQRLVILGILSATLAGGCSKPAETPAASGATAASAPAGGNRKYLLETVDDAAVVQYYADGFDKLSL